MGEDIQDTIVEIKTALLMASTERLKQLAEEFLPLLSETSRTKIFVAFEGYLADIAKEEGSDKKLEEILEKVKTVPTVKETATVKLEPTAIKEEKETGEVKPDVYKSLRREFKISGAIGDGPTCIGYPSLLRQIDSGKSHGYADRDIVDGIIRAIQPGSKLRGYLEGRSSVTLPKVQAIVRAAYKEKDATELYQELCALKQGKGESIQEFLFRALELKQKITFSCKDSDLPTYDEHLVLHQFRHSLSTGIRNDSIRSESLTLINSFKNDEQLIREMNLIERRHMECEEKLKTKKEVANLNVEESEILKELRALKVEVNELKSQRVSSETDHRRSTMDSSRRPRRKRTCESCQNRNQSDCRHCWNCGAGDHLARRCQKNGTGSMSKGGH